MDRKNAYIVNIDFCGELESDAVGERLIVGQDAFNGVREFVKKALNDIVNIGLKVEADGYMQYTSEILHDDELLDEFIESGGYDDPDGWKIKVDEYG